MSPIWPKDMFMEEGLAGPLFDPLPADTDQCLTCSHLWHHPVTVQGQVQAEVARDCQK